MSIIERVGGRKFIVTATTGFAACVLVWFTKISDGVFETVILGTVGLFIAGNVVQKVKADQARSTDKVTEMENVATDR